MDPKHDSGRMALAPGAATNTPNYAFPTRSTREGQPTPAPFPAPFPRVDDHIVQPEVTRDEVICGRKVVAMPANPPHADTQVQVDFVIMPHVREGYVASADLLTRVSDKSNFATDVGIRKEGIDPQTDARYLEELSFEIVNEQTLSDVTEKACELMKRGVRRVFAIFVKTGEISEWSKTQSQFVALAKDSVVEDPLFIRPMAVQALIDRTLASAEVVRALDQQGHPEIAKIEQRGIDKGHKKGLDEGHKKGLDEGHKKGLDEALGMSRNMLVRLARMRFGELPASILNRIHSADAQAVTVWADTIEQASSLDAVFGL